MIMEISNTTVDVKRANIGPNYFDEIESFPENIFYGDSQYSLYGSLKARIKDIQNGL